MSKLTGFAVVLLFFLPYSSLANPISAEHHDTTASRQLTQSKTLNRRVEPSSYPYGDALTNEFQWRNWDPNDKDQQKDAEKIHKAFIEWHDFAKAGLEAASDPNGDIYKRWFGKQPDDSDIKNVFAAAYDSKAGTATANVKKMICDRLDFKSGCKERMAAYTMPDTGEFTVCPFGLDRGLNSDIECSKLDESCSAAMRSLPMTLMHEMTHVTFIGDDARGFPILDVPGGRGAYGCFKLSDEDKGDNAQNYAWLAGEAYWSGKCSKTFKDPDPAEPTTQDDQAIDSISGLNDPTCMGQNEFHQEEADAAIVKLCGNFQWQDRVIVPLVSIGNEMTSDGRPKVYQIEEKFPINGGADSLWFSISFAESSCVGMFQFDQTKCLTNMRKVLNDCDTEGLFPKHGGLIRDSCAVYQMAAAPVIQGSPIFLLAQSPKTSGEFTCTDTDVSVLGPNSPLAGTCTCWYSGMQSVTDIFNRPDGGCAAVKSDSNPKTN